MSPSGDRNTLESSSVEQDQMLEFLRRRDRVGMLYLNVERLRRKRNLTKHQRGILRQFDDDRRRILRDPAAVLNEAGQGIHRNLLLLESVIHEKRTQNASEETDATLYDAACHLSLLAADLCNTLIRLAEDGSGWACASIFRDGKALASAFSRLAITDPARFREVAEHSLTMPSLRARNPKFTCDAKAIIESTHLAGKHHAANLHDNRTRIGALCHQVVAEIVNLIEAARLEIIQNGNTKHQYCALPNLHGNAAAWWKIVVKDRVYREFDFIKKHHHRNPALWQELGKITDQGTDSAKRAAFEKYCFNKLEQIASQHLSLV